MTETQSTDSGYRDLGFRQVSRSAYARSTGRVTDIYLGHCEMHDRPVRYEGTTSVTPVAGQPGTYRIWCPVPEAGASGHWIAGAERLVAVTTNVTCDGACMSARRPSCDCGCGGMNHGRSWGTTATSEEFESALARYQAEKARTEAKREQRRQSAQRKLRRDFAAWREDQDPKVLAHLDAYPADGTNCFLADLAGQLRSGRMLSERQMDAAGRSIERDAVHAARRAAMQAEIDERKATAKPVPDGGGRVTVTGKIIKIKASEGYADSIRFQMIVAAEDGYAVMGSVPAVIEDYAMAERREQIWEGVDTRRPSYEPDYYGASQRWTNALKGVEVTFDAALARSEKDPTFGYFKRPTRVSFEKLPA